MRNFFLIPILLFLSCAAAPHVLKNPETRIVIDPVVDVRAQPVRREFTYANDPLQETQVLEGEPVLVLEKRGSWVRVECPQQMEFTHHSKWEGYPGWIEEKSLSADLSREKKVERSSLPEDALRQEILKQARRHLDTPYLWGGRSLRDASYKRTVTGVDCSGLVNWSFLQVGWLVPRDSQEQYMKAKQIEASELKPADLIFSAKASDPHKIVHVSFYAGDGLLIEAPQTWLSVRAISFADRFGVPHQKIKNGQTLGDRVVYFGTFFSREK